MLAALGLIGAGILAVLGVALANAQHISTDELGPAGWLAFWGGWVLIFAGVAWAAITVFRTSRQLVGPTKSRLIRLVRSQGSSGQAETRESPTDMRAGSLIHSEISNDLGKHEFSEGLATQPTSDISMADEAKRKATIRTVTQGLRKRWKADEPKVSSKPPTGAGSPAHPTGEEMTERKNQFAGDSLIEPIAERIEGPERELDGQELAGAEQIAPSIPPARPPDKPPEGWTGQFWQGKQILPCPWDDYRTNDERAFLAHRDTHTEPPTDPQAQEVSTMPWPWARGPIHFLGGGTHYFTGVPADPDHTLYATANRAEELIASGLYGAGPVATQPHAFSGAVGRTIVCLCGFEAPTMADFQSHLIEAG